MKDSDITNIFEFEVEQTSSNSWILTSEENLNEFTKEEIINEVYEFCEGYEVEIITEY